MLTVREEVWLGLCRGVVVFTFLFCFLWVGDKDGMNGLWIMGWDFTKSKVSGWESYTLVGLHLAMEFWSLTVKHSYNGGLRKDVLGGGRNDSILFFFF